MNHQSGIAPHKTMRQKTTAATSPEVAPLMPVHVVNHPLITHKMTILRDKNTGTQLFREAVSEVTLLLCYEATRDLTLRKCDIETPVCPMETETLSGKDFVIAPVLRAGLGMVNGMLSLFPNARLSHIGVKRNEETALPSTYYSNIPRNLENSTVFVVDPMLATGGSLSAALTLLKERKPRVLRALCLLAAPRGKERIEHDHPDVQVFVGALDRELNERCFIVPGLGDAGDRMFGTL